MEEGQGSKRAGEAATAVEVQIEDVGSSSELSLSTASSAMLKHLKTTDAERRKERKERRVAKTSRREKREKIKKLSILRTRSKEKKIEDAFVKNEKREG
jgi:hypothetical protein